MGDIPSVAAHCGPDYGSDIDCHILGTSGLVRNQQSYLYGYYIRIVGYRVYRSEYSIWNLMRSDDAEF